MKMNRFSLILAGVAVLLLVASGTALAAGGKTSTAQSIMVNLRAAGTFAIVQQDTYEYNTTEAALWFTNEPDPDSATNPVRTVDNHFDSSAAVPVVTPTPPSEESPCAPPAPAAPGAPPALESKLVHVQGSGGDDVVGQNKCNFLNGLTLTGDTYTQDTTASSTCFYISKVAEVKPSTTPKTYKVTTTTLTRIDTFTYAYTIAPTVPEGKVDGNADLEGVQAPAPDFVNQVVEAWDLGSSTGGGSASIDVGGEVAGLSVISSSKVPHKFSFSIEQPDPGTGLPVNRVTGLVVTVDGTVNLDGTVTGGTPYDATSQVVKNLPGSTPNVTVGPNPPTLSDPTQVNINTDPCTWDTSDTPCDGSVDFWYRTNAGSNGNTSLLTYGIYGENQDARTTLNNDTFTGNQDGGTDGSALALAVMDPVNILVGEGDHTVTLTGTVKGNNALANLPFSVTQDVHVITPGCSQ